MTNLKAIEQRFDEKFNVYGRPNPAFRFSNPHPDDIKSFYHKEIVQLLEGLKGRYLGEGSEAKLYGKESTEFLRGYNVAVKDHNAKIDKLIEEA